LVFSSLEKSRAANLNSKLWLFQTKKPLGQLAVIKEWADVARGIGTSVVHEPYPELKTYQKKIKDVRELPESTQDKKIEEIN
jgi:hypothetical protein